MSAALAGMIGPVLFGGVLLALSVLEYDFMLGIGWRPVANPSGAWPSGLALGPYGLAQVVNFVVSGLLLAFFAIGVHLETTEVWARLATRSSFPLCGGSGDGAYGLRDRPDTEDRTT
jgi:hypothetical protein